VRVLLISIFVIIGQTAYAKLPATLGLKARAACTAKEKSRALDLLRTHNPEGYRIYEQEPAAFMDPIWWTDCKTAIVDAIVVALHETVHHLSISHYPLLNSSKIPYGDDRDLFPPARIAKSFKADRFTEIYLSTGQEASSSGTMFSVLLDEMNAYTHGLNTENALTNFVTYRQWRSGAAATMAYVKEYVDLAKRQNPRAWIALQKHPTAGAIRVLWAQGEGVLRASCHLPDPDDREDLQYLKHLCRAEPEDGLVRLLGRRPYCPAEC